MSGEVFVTVTCIVSHGAKGQYILLLRTMMAANYIKGKEGQRLIESDAMGLCSSDLQFPKVICHYS